MRILHHINSLIILCIMPFAAHADSQPFSQYGTIQNVQNYSSNPFWNPNGPYNQRMPQPVYATGTAIETAECQRVVSTLVAAQCTLQNNCVSTQLSDIRPAIMLQLSRMPNGNYATACAGYIDTAYEQYKNQNVPTVPGYAVAFPTATTPNPTVNQPAYKIPNPITARMQANFPEWASDMIGRYQEIQELESETETHTPELVATEFPTTYADLSFSERMAIETAGYAPYKDSNAYVQLEIQDQKDYEQEKIERLELEKRRIETERAIFCAKHPNDKTCQKPQGNSTQTETATPEQQQTPTPNMSESEKQSLIDRIIKAFPQ